MLKNNVGIVNEGSLVKFKLHTQAAVDWWNDNVDDFNKDIRAKALRERYVEHRYANDIYQGMLEYFGK
jgi:hypothetical protein